MDGMDVMVLDNNFNVIGIVDDYQSLIWTERYNEAGDFQLDGDLNSTVFTYCKLGYYAKIESSDTIMVIESIEAEEQPRTSDKITVKGRSLESILDRRIIWGFITIGGNIQDIIKQVLIDNVISPIKDERRIPNFIFSDNPDPSLESISFNSMQYDCENLYDVICGLCQAGDIGFKIRLSGNLLIFNIYNGTDRSKRQTTNPAIIFSEEYDNVIENRYSANKTSYKNVALVNGEPYEQPSGEYDDHNKFRVIAGDQSASGLDRFEVSIDSGLNSKDAQTGQPLTVEEYTNQVIAKGTEELSAMKVSEVADGKLVEDYFLYGFDYFVGDIVQYDGLFGLSSPVRITEFIRCLDASGYKEYPSYILLEGGNKNV